MSESLKTIIVTLIKLSGIFIIWVIFSIGIFFSVLTHDVSPTSEFFVDYRELEKDYHGLVEKYGDEKPSLKELSPRSFYYDERNYHAFTVDENKIQGIYRLGNYGYVRTYFFDSEETHSFGIRFK